MSEEDTKQAALSNFGENTLGGTRATADVYLSSNRENLDPEETFPMKLISISCSQK